MRLLRNWIEFLKRQVHPPESSIPFRVVVALSVLIGIVATCHQLEWPAYGFLTMILTPVGFVVSYQMRRANTWLIKALLSVGMVLALLQFFAHLGASTWDPRLPLAELLLWLQTLHSFDLPARRDLNYSLLVGLILISLAAVLSTGMLFVLYLLAFGPVALLALHYSYLSRLGELSRRPPPQLVLLSELPAAGLRTAGSTVGLLLCAVAIFLLLPRYEGLRLRALPVSWDIQFGLPRTSQGEVVNPSYPDFDPNRPGVLQQDNYAGFNPVVNLNARGELSDEVVMSVRSSDWTYYHALAFDLYDGRSWSLSDTELETLVVENPPLMIPLEGRGDRQIVQIFTIQRQLPNLIFGAYQPYQLFFPSTEIYLDKQLSLRSPFPLEEGMTYSLISLSPRVPPRRLKKISSRKTHPPPLRPFLQLPELSARVKKLTHGLTDGYTSDFEKASALCLHLQQSYRYTLDIPPFPRDSEMVDYFLFEQKAGYCEQFATAMTVMCREAGIPARYVNGYLPGTYNPFTGAYEVKNNEAHAWTEIFIRTVGWVAFDPSPGFVANPEFEQPVRSRWLLTTLLDYLKSKVSPDDLAVLQSWTGRIMGAWWLAALALGLWGLLRAIAWAGRRSGRLGRTARRASRALARALGRGPRTPREEVLQLYREMEELLAVNGRARPRHVTPRAFARNLSQPGVEKLTACFEIARYSDLEVSQSLARDCREALESLQEDIVLQHSGSSAPR